MCIFYERNDHKYIGCINRVCTRFQQELEERYIT